MTIQKLRLAGPRFEITVDAGDAIAFEFINIPLNTTGYTWEFLFWAMATGSGKVGPTGEPIAALTLTSNPSGGITNTPGSTSTVSVEIPESHTADLRGTKLWGALVRVDAGFRRTYSKGEIVIE